MDPGAQMGAKRDPKKLQRHPKSLPKTLSQHLQDTKNYKFCRGFKITKLWESIPLYSRIDNSESPVANKSVF